MPLAADWAEVSLALPREAEHEGGIERIALRAIAPLAHTHALPLVAGGFLHRP